MPAVVRQFKTQFPDVHLELTRIQTNEQVKALIEGDIHAGFLHPPVDTQSLSYEVIYQEPLVAVIPSAHPLAKDASYPISIKAFTREPIVIFPRQRGPVLYDSVISFCKEAGFTPNIAQEAFPQRTILGLVAAGVGIALIHSSAQQIAQQGTVARPIIEQTPVVQTVIAWPTDTVHPALFNLLNVARALSQVNFHMDLFKETADKSP